MTTIDDLINPIIPWNPLKHKESPIYAEFNSIRSSLKLLNDLPPLFQKLYFQIISGLNPENFNSEGEKMNFKALFEEDFFKADGAVGWYKTRLPNEKGENHLQSNHQHYFYPGRPPSFSPGMPLEIEAAVLNKSIFELDNSQGIIKGVPKGYNLFAGLNGNANFIIQLYMEGQRGFSDEKKQLFSLFADNINARFDSIRDAKVDRLVGLINQNKYVDLFTIGAEESLNMDGNYSVVLMDLDHFKRFNDKYGHSTGDKVLNTLGYIVNNAVREHDLAARYGGEELTLLVRGGLDAAHKVVQRIRDAMAQKPFVKDDGTPIIEDVTISAGIYSTEQEFESQLCEQIPDLRERLKMQIKYADIALYDCKGAGRNCVSVYKAEVNDQLLFPFVNP